MKVTTDFIAEYQQGFSENTCDFLVEHFDKMPRYENFINGEQAGTQQQALGGDQRHRRGVPGPGEVKTLDALSLGWGEEDRAADFPCERR